MSKRTPKIRRRCSYRLPASTLERIERLRDIMATLDPMQRRPSQADAITHAVKVATKEVKSSGRQALRLAMQQVSTEAAALNAELRAQRAERIALKAVKRFIDDGELPPPPPRNNPWRR